MKTTPKSIGHPLDHRRAIGEQMLWLLMLNRGREISAACVAVEQMVRCMTMVVLPCCADSTSGRMPGRD